MNLHNMLSITGSQNPIRVGVIGGGKFGSMFISQALNTTGIYLAAIADLKVDQVRHRLQGVGLDESRICSTSVADAVHNGRVFVTDTAGDLTSSASLDVIVEATGNARAGVIHARDCIRNGIHIVMANVEADVLGGPLLAGEAVSQGVIYSMAYGDQPALIHELVEWARAVGLDVVCAGKGTKFLPKYHQSTPDTVWEYYGIDEQEAIASGMNPKMFNSYIDTTAAVAQAHEEQLERIRSRQRGSRFG